MWEDDSKFDKFVNFNLKFLMVLCFLMLWGGLIYLAYVGAVAVFCG